MNMLALITAVAPIDSAQVNVGGELLRVIASLCGIIALILAAGFLNKRLQRRAGTGGRRIRCVESFAVGARDRLLLVDADGKRLLIGIGQGGMHTLHVYEQAPADQSTPGATPLSGGATPAATPFGELLARWKTRP